MRLSRKLQVFLLYARIDQEAVQRLYRRIERDGARVWLDVERILPGQDWAYEIRKAIRTSDLIIVCLSKGFNRRGGYRHEELKIALRKAKSLPDGEIFLIPSRLEECELPEPLRRWQCMDLFKAGGYKRFLSALKEGALVR